jgi:hypothetical protein
MPVHVDHPEALASSSEHAALVDVFAGATKGTKNEPPAPQPGDKEVVAEWVNPVRSSFDGPSMAPRIEDTIRCSKGFQFLSRHKESPR